MAGKVLVPIREHIERLIAARLQADVMGTELVLVARTDSEAATLLNSDIDERDHQFLIGTTNSGKEFRPLREIIKDAEDKGMQREELEKLETNWTKQARLMRFNLIYFYIPIRLSNCSLLHHSVAFLMFRGV